MFLNQTKTAIIRNLIKVLNWLLKSFLRCFIIFFVGNFTVLCGSSQAQSNSLLNIDIEQDVSNFGWIKIESNYPIQRIWLDSLEVAVVGRNIYKLPIGQHKVLVMPAYFESWMLRQFETEIEVSKGDTLVLLVSFPEFKMINSAPFGALVILNGSIRGETPILLPLTDLKQYPLTLQKQGFRDTTLYDLDALASLILIPLSRDDLSIQQHQKLNNIQYHKRRKDRKVSLLTFGLSLASGVTAILLKQKADNNFNRYRKAGNPEDIKYLFDQAKKYDRLAAGAYIVFEINFVTSAYFLFRSILRE